MSVEKDSCKLQNSQNLTTNICNIELNNPIMNASGVWCTTEDELIQLATSSSGAFVSKSSTLNHREGNPEPR